MSDQHDMNVQVNKSDTQSPAVKGASSPNNVDEQEVKLVEVEEQWKMEKGRSHRSNVQSDKHLPSAVSKAATQGSSFEPSGPTATIPSRKRREFEAASLFTPHS